MEEPPRSSWSRIRATGAVEGTEKMIQWLRREKMATVAWQKED